MTNLISAQFQRLLKNKIFYISCIIFILYTLLGTIPDMLYAFKEAENFINLKDDLEPFFQPYSCADVYMKLGFRPYIIITPLLISMILGREYSDGTTRNKIIIGHSRASIYISNLIACTAAEIIMQIIYIIAVIIPTIVTYIICKNAGIPDVHIFELSFAENLVFEFIGFLIMISYSSIFLIFSMALSSRSRAAIFSLVFAVLLIAVSSSLYGKIWSPDNDVFNYGSEDFVNPNEFDSYTDYLDSLRGYGLSETKRSVLCFFDDFLPTRQASNMVLYDKIPTRASLYIIYDIGISAVSTAFGIFLFSRKELK